MIFYISDILQTLKLVRRLFDLFICLHFHLTDKNGDIFISYYSLVFWFFYLFYNHIIS